MYTITSFTILNKKIDFIKIININPTHFFDRAARPEPVDESEPSRSRLRPIEIS